MSWFNLPCFNSSKRHRERIHEMITSHHIERELRDFQTIIELRCALKAHEVQWNRLQDAIAGMEKTMEAHGIDYFKWQPMTFDETLKGDAP